ncbi:type I-C CRISPR-associated endonuclease Cas1c [Porphyromonas circumdentaria]|uniref:CRISPR-associated endonuclease Cas1 n=1 Tax=Porphyromonas circumdentaria TaxID=29524 RepID=A0A1T4NSI5_9PORP|nr:type I-C CRISPR-associated endonuclease Cas1c [Porphyromonas circumdentaria]MBB6276180.1 CRISPR-associated protein Cas1 [Porphyromonas circumdentaria]SJZ82223.1 CRISP-associated protein Cas1 [Porphyromonas circumdentaria]
MKKLLNTLYILSPDGYLCKDGENLVIRINDVEALRIPIHNLESILSFSRTGASPGAMYLCVQNGIKLSFLSPTGRYIGSLEGGIKGNVLLRRTQYRIADDELTSTHIAAIFIAGKIANQRAVLSRLLRDHPLTNTTTEAIREVILQLKYEQKRIGSLRDRQSILGVEGNAAKLYFSVFEHLILNPEFPFTGRHKRPPKDMVNALLSFFYTILSLDVRSALESVGLDPFVGFLHVDRPGRPSLGLDLMEELRAYLVDRFVLSLINKKQISPKDFLSQGENGIILKEDARKKLLTLWQRRKKEEITHPFLKEKMPLGLLPYIQALLLSRYLRGDINDYPIFLIQ